ncbi:LysR family transcriptional regulator [Idiomarina xiamenensis]|uniref:LysR family transcriptional regulator n=1 Tax=Idiomarina xiamenensis 10-D-4 TaxID=740709 RepID=K2L3K4_9GAMM|nr:LysR family transcriptional regulator [Idiomarina xiamenensis]EKE84445.1 LysR family transcriptional regulator [Idiomarina xiamenensis 10-D-4]
MNQLSAIQAFLKVVDLGSYTRAADALNLSRTQVSKLVMQLEQALGARLLQRTTRRLQLTDAGARYRDKAQLALQQLDDAAAELSASTNKVHGRLRINGPMSFGIRYLAPLLTEFMQQHPQLTVQLDLNDRRVDLLEEGYDMAIRIGHLDDASYVAKPLATCAMHVVAAPDYLARQGTPRALAELKQHRCLTYHSSRHGNTWHIAKQAISVDSYFASNNGDSLVIAAEAGLGIAYQPSFLVQQSIRQGRLRTLFNDQPAEQLGVYAVYPARQYLSANVRLLSDYLKQGWGNPATWDID